MNRRKLKRRTGKEKRETMNMKRTILGETMPRLTEPLLCAVIALAVIGLVTADTGPGYMTAEADWRPETQTRSSFDVTNRVAIRFNTFEVTTNYSSPGATWFDDATSILARKRDEITDEQAMEKLLGYKPKTDINFLKGLLFMREAAETMGIGGAIDWQTKIQLQAIHQLIEEKRRELKQQLNSTNPSDPMADMNTKGTM